MTIDYSKIITAADKFEQAREAKLAQINAAADAEVAVYKKGYPQFEIETWSTQQLEAAAYQADPEAATPWCDRAAARRGIDRIDFLGRVIAKVEAFQVISADVAGHRQRLERQILAIDPKSRSAWTELEAIVWTTPLDVPPEQPES